MPLPVIHRVGIQTAPPAKIDVFADLNHAIHTKTNGPQDEKTLSVMTTSSVLSAVVSMFGWAALEPLYITPVEAATMGGESPAPSVNTVFYLAMGSVMHCVKPITHENSQYVENRWSAMAATHASEGSTIPAIRVEPSSLAKVASSCRPYIRAQGIVEALVKGDTTYANMYSQIKMVYAGSGMKLVEEMKSFSTKPYTCAILLTPVMEQARVYLEKYNAIKRDNPVNFEYGRIMLKNELEPLDAANYPDLYWATYYSMRKRVTPNFKTSSHQPATPKDVIKRFARVHLTDFGTISEENKQVLSALGVNLEIARRKAEQLAKARRHIDDGSDSGTNSDTGQPAKKRRRAGAPTDV